MPSGTRNPLFSELVLLILRVLLWIGLCWRKGSVVLRQGRAKKRLDRISRLQLQHSMSIFRATIRGKLIMACGTGKTYTSLKIAENQTGGKGLVLFLAPSIALVDKPCVNGQRKPAAPFSPSASALILKSAKARPRPMMSMMDTASRIWHSLPLPM